MSDLQDLQDGQRTARRAGRRLAGVFVVVSGAAMIGTALIAPPLLYVLAVLVLGFGTDHIAWRVTGGPASTWIFLLSMIVLADGVAHRLLWGNHGGGTFESWQAKTIIFFAYFLPLYLFPHPRAARPRAPHAHR